MLTGNLNIRESGLYNKAVSLRRRSVKVTSNELLSISPLFVILFFIPTIMSPITRPIQMLFSKQSRSSSYHLYK